MAAFPGAERRESTQSGNSSFQKRTQATFNAKAQPTIEAFLSATLAANASLHLPYELDKLGSFHLTQQIEIASLD